MKRFLLLLVTLFSFSFFGGAQSLDAALEQLEIVRTQKGEQSQEFLSALDYVIQQAADQNQIETALFYRQNHLNILKEMRGELCVEVADDLWRLGNSYNSIGEKATAHNSFLEAAQIFETIGTKNIDDEYKIDYGVCLISLLKDCASSNNKEKVAYYSAQLEKVSRSLYNLNDCNYLNLLYRAALFNYDVGNMDITMDYCTMIVDNCLVIDSCNYSCVSSAYDNLIRQTFFQEKNNNKSKELANKYLTKLRESGDGFSYGKAVALFWHSAIWFEEDTAYSVECGKKAEQILIDHYGDNPALLHDSYYYPIASQLAQQAEALGNYQEEVKYCDICCQILIANDMRGSEDYYLYLDHLFKAAEFSFQNQIAIDVSEELEQLISLYSNDIIGEICDFNKRMCDIYAQALQYDRAIVCCNKVIEIEENVFHDTIACAKSLYRKAQLYRLQGNNEKTFETIREGRNLLGKESSTIQALSVKANYLSLESSIVTDYYDLSMSKIDSALTIHNYLLEMGQQLSISEYEDVRMELAFDLKRKGELLCISGNYQEALRCYYEASNVFNDYCQKKNPTYVDCLLALAACQIVCYEYTEGLNTLETVKPYVLEVFGENSPQYTYYLDTYALYYKNTNSYRKAMEYYLQSADIKMALFGEYSAEYAINLENTAHFLEVVELHEEAENLLYKLVLIMDSIGFEHPRVEIHAKVTLAHIWNSMGYYDRADSLYKETLRSAKDLYGGFSKQVASILNSWGFDLYFQRADPKAFQYFSESLAIYDSINNSRTNPDEIDLLTRYIASGIEFNKELNINYLQLFPIIEKNILIQYLTYYSTNDREKEYTRIPSAKNVFFNAAGSYPIERSLFDVELLSKSFLLNTSQWFQKAVYRTERQDLIYQYENIQALQRVLDNQSFGKLLEGQTPEQLIERKASMERMLMVEMKTLGYTVNDSIGYNDIRQSLMDNEIAIEFVDFYHIKDQRTYYIALIAKSSWENPVYVQLCTEDDLKNCIGNPNVTYSTDDLYRLIWQPLAEYINEGEKVYFSPSGMLHTIALESLHTPDGSCLSDKYNLVRLTSTRELCKERQPKTYETGAVYGGLQYDVDQQRMTEVAAKNKTASEEIPVFALRGEDRGNWNYLQGTKDEVEHIVGIMRQANIGCELFEGDLGNEESFKALSGTNIDIIHLATHGYFIEGEKADMNDFMKSLSPLARQKTDSVIDPLLRSGLLLSGGNRAWLGHDVPEGIEDGVLTALEISTMNLSGTDMVVMSACETGLGDITSDGVFGLQRAFKMAGVQTLVMSLWKVDDNATSLMMQTFYEHLLSGMSKREAFNIAQAAVRAKFPEPYYWAGFVMLD